MARKYEYQCGKFAWNPDRCEEKLIISAYEEVVRFIPPNQRWKWGQEFESLFYERGCPLGFHLLKAINDTRKRKCLVPIVLVESDISLWGRATDKRLRAERRQELRDEIRAMSPDQIGATVREAQAEAAAMPEPHRTYDEWRDEEAVKKAAQKAETAASRAAVAKRLRGNSKKPEPVPAPEQKPEPSPDQRVVKVSKMLALTDNAELQQQIIDKLSPAEALDLEAIELLNALVRHSLGGI